jgi:hypothetical protein
MAVVTVAEEAPGLQTRRYVKATAAFKLLKQEEVRKAMNLKEAELKAEETRAAEGRAAEDSGRQRRHAKSMTWEEVESL